jgi:hypothetical protein
MQGFQGFMSMLWSRRALAKHLSEPEMAARRAEWQKSAELRYVASVTWFATIFWVGALVALWIFVLGRVDFSGYWSIQILFVLLVLPTLLSFSIYLSIVRTLWNSSVHGFMDRRSLEIELDHIDEAAKDRARADDSGRLPPAGINFDFLWRETQERLSVYHRMATGQSAKSYRNSQIAIIAGFAILLLCVLLASFVASPAGVLTAGGIAAIGAVLTGYLTRTFMQMYRSTSEQLRSYFDQPLDFSRNLGAERLLSQITDDSKRAEAVVEIIRASYRTADRPVADPAPRRRSRGKRSKPKIPAR